MFLSCWFAVKLTAKKNSSILFAVYKNVTSLTGSGSAALIKRHNKLTTGDFLPSLHDGRY